MSTVLETIAAPEVADAPPAEDRGAEHAGDVPVTIIEPRTGWRLVDWQELLQYRDLFRFLVWRSIKVRYAQSTLGVGWAIIQPLFSMVVFTIVFGKLAGIESDGVPYAVFSFCALVPWTYFANALTEGTSSLVSEANMLRKVYFPRLVLPLSAVLAKLVDFTIAMGMLALLIGWFHFMPQAGASGEWKVSGGELSVEGGALANEGGKWKTASGAPHAGSGTLQVESGELRVEALAASRPWSFRATWRLTAVPLLVGLMMLTAAGLGLWLTALAVQYRDVNYAMNFVVQLLMYAAPVVYPASLIPEQYRLAYAINPMVGVIEGFRAALLGTRAMPWDMLAVGSVSALVVAVTGCLYFRRKERIFADVA